MRQRPPKYHPPAGYRSRRQAFGCVSLLVWVGVLVNVGLIVWSIRGDADLFAWRSPPGTMDAATRAFQSGNLDATISEAQIVLANDPGHIEATSLLVRAFIYRSYSDFEHEGDRAVALDVVERAVQRGNTSPLLLATHAFALQANGQAVKAAEIARTVLESDPQNILARTALALSYARVGSFDVALRESQQALESAPSQGVLDAQRAVAISLSDLGNYAQAGDMIETAIQAHPRLVPLYFEQALYALQVGDADTASAAYFQVLGIDPENVKARMRLCELSSTMGERQSAVEYCQQVTERSPDYAQGWYRLGREYFLMGEFETAQTHLNQCSTLQVSQNVPVDERIFECWYLQGQAAEIRGDCRSLVAIYNQFRILSADTDVRETWVYPPEGPPMCTNGAS